MPGSAPCETDTFHTSNAPVVESEERILPNVQKSLHLLLKPDISKLCKILKLSVCNLYTLLKTSFLHVWVYLIRFMVLWVSDMVTVIPLFDPMI